MTKPARSKRLKGPVRISGPILATSLSFLVVVLVVAGCGVWLLTKTRNLQNQSDQLTQQLATSRSTGSTGQNGEGNTLADQLTAQEALIVPWSTVMQDVAASVGTVDVTVDSFNGSGTTLQLAGRSTGIAAISQFTQSLKKYPWVASIQLQSMNESSTDAGAIFQRSSQWKDVGGKTIQVAPQYSYAYDLAVTLRTGSGDGQ